MNRQSLRSTRRSKFSNLSNCSKPTKFRVIYKSRSGLLSDVQQVLSQTLTQQKMNATGSSFASSNKLKQLSKKFTENIEQTSKSQKKQYSKKQKQADCSQLGKIRLPVIRQTPSQLQNQQNPENEQDEININIASIEELQRKVDELIQLKLIKAAQGAKQQLQKNKQVKQLEKQLNIIVQYLQKDSSQTGQEDTLETTNKKIAILEKIMAEGATESDIAKKYFYKKINNKKAKKPDLSQYRTDIKQIKQKTKQLMRLKPPASIHYESLSHINYIAPSKQAYPKKKQKQEYQFKNQPIQRSSYDCQYLSYGGLPQYRHKQEDFSVPSLSLGKKTSSYQDQYKAKTAQRVNFKQLDCFQDKFKNLKIPLIYEGNNSIVKNSTISYLSETPKNIKLSNRQKSDRQLDKIQKQDKALIKGERIIRLKSQPNEPLHYIKQLNTESHSNFKGEDNKIRSQIKHKNLHAMKYAYKASIHV